MQQTLKIQGKQKRTVRRGAKPLPAHSSGRPALRPQRTGSNHGTLHRLEIAVQPKLVVGSLGDRYEREADRAAEHATRGPDTGIRLSARAPNRGRMADTPAVVSNAIRSGGGQAVERSARAAMESRFRHDFGAVRVHTDARAAAAARALGARAFTVGRDVVFGAGQYAPQGTPGKKLLAHELAHVVQQSSTSTPAIQLQKAPASQKQTLTKSTLANIVVSNILDYREQVKSGIRSWKAPTKKESEVWFWIALAGNLAWAATSFINPMATAVIRTLAMVGAAVGSGLLKKALDNQAQVPDIRPKLIIQISTFCDKLKGNVGRTVDGTYAFFVLRDKLSPSAGWLDANKKDQDRRRIVWNMMFDGKVASWRNSTAIIKNTTRDVGAIWKRFSLLFERDLMWGLWDRHVRRMPLGRLRNRVMELFYQAQVESGVAARSPAVKVSKRWKGLKEYKVYEFPPPQAGWSGASVWAPTGRRIIPVELVPR